MRRVRLCRPRAEEGSVRAGGGGEAAGDGGGEVAAAGASAAVAPVDAPPNILITKYLNQKYLHLFP